MLRVLLGVALVLLLFVDVFVTVLHPRGRGGPVTWLLGRGVWRTFRTLGATGDGSARGGLLSYSAPVQIVVTITTWIALLVGGFALIYSPWIDVFYYGSSKPEPSWAEALYYSGYVGSTLGLGDVIASRTALRLLTPIQAFTGFALLTATLSYVLSTYSSAVRMHQLASSLSSYSSGVDPLGRQLGDTHVEALTRYLDQVSGELAYTTQAHYQYPILHYFRPVEHSRALQAQLGFLLDLRRAIYGADRSTPLGGLREHPSFLSLKRALEQFFGMVDRYFLPDRFGGARADGGSGDTERVHARQLRYMGYP